jgi:hypothetical protein
MGLIDSSVDRPEQTKNRYQGSQQRRQTLRVRGKRKERVAYFGREAAKSPSCVLKGRRAGYLVQDKNCRRDYGADDGIGGDKSDLATSYFPSQKCVF